MSDIAKHKETLERMGKAQRHKIKKSKKEMKVDHLGQFIFMDTYIRGYFSSV